MISLRPLNESDVTCIKKWPPYPGDMAQMDYALRDQGWLDEFGTGPDARLFAAEDGDELIGFTILARTGDGGAEFRIALRPDMAGMGFGAPVTVQTLRLGFDDRSLSSIHLIVRENNCRGIALYRRIGFSDRGECRKEIQGEPVDFRVMEIGRGEFARLYDESTT